MARVARRKRLLYGWRGCMITACARRESGVWTPVSRRVTGVQAPPSRREDFAGAYAPCTRRLYGVYTASIRRLYGVYITSRSRLELVYFPLLTPSTRRLRAAHAPSTRRLCADILYGKVSRLFLNFAPSNLSSLCVTRTALYVAFIRDSVRGALGIKSRIRITSCKCHVIMILAARSRNNCVHFTTESYFVYFLSTCLFMYIFLNCFMW